MNGKQIKTVADLVKKASEKHGKKVFIRYEKEEIIREVTYEEFLKLCGSVAAWCEEKSSEAGYKIRAGILGGSSKAFVSALFGVMSNGNVAVPLDIQLNIQGVAEYIERADIDYLFYDWDFYEMAEDLMGQCSRLKGIVCLQNRTHLDCIHKIWKEYQDYSLDAAIDPKECALILFTSGTTGRGKGVMLSHENLISNVFSTEFDAHDPDEVTLNVLPVHHVFCLHGDFLLTLKDGNVVCLNQDMLKLGAHLQLFQPTTIATVPMMAKGLYNKVVMLQKQHQGLSLERAKELVFGKNIRKVACGGGYLAPELAEHYREMGILIGQGYGMTECSPKISAADYTRPDKAASVGRIVDGCQVRIEEGEIQVKSPSVMMGYYKDPKETAEAFTEDGWLKTGDLGYFDEEGFLFFTGRCKNLIVLSNGENVAPEQLENLFEDENLIEDILVYGEDDRICAEVYPNLTVAKAMGIEEIEKAVLEIVQKQNEQLPGYKKILKTSIRYVPFEKTASKKIIREKYFEQKARQAHQQENFRKPQNDVQQLIFDCVAESLGHQHFGIDTNLYEAGMDSLGCVMLLSGLYEKMELAISLQELSENPTIELLEKFSEIKKESQLDYSVRETYPLIGIQKYFGYILRGNTTSNLPFLFRLDENIDIDRLKKAVEDVFEVHPELKNIIQPGSSGMLENFRDDRRQIQIPVIELDQEEWEKEKEKLVCPFLFTKGEAIFHSAIYVIGTQKYFFFDLAHIAGDGMSINIIFEDINALYCGEKLKPQSYTFYEYILDEEERRSKGKREECIHYFMKQTENLKIGRTILNRKDFYDLEKGVNGTLFGTVKGLYKEDVKAFCERNNISENVFFLTAFNYCISVFANQDDVLCTSTHSGRTDSRWYRLVGPIYMTYYHRFTRKPHETVPQLLHKSANQILRTMDYPLTNVRADEMFFQYQGNILNLDTIGDRPAKLEIIELDAIPFHLQVMENKEEYAYQLRFWKNRYKENQLEIFLDCYKAILQAMLTEASVRRLKKYIPDTCKPKHFRIEAGKLNKAAGRELLRDIACETRVKAYVLDQHYLKKPFGGWGDLYIMDHPTVDFVDKIENPTDSMNGIFYQTGYTARITQEGEVEFLHDTGRTVMIETLMGREYVDLQRVEEVLCEYEAVSLAQAYTYYGGDNVILVGADVKGIPEEEAEQLRAFAAERLKPVWVPARIQCS